MNPPLGWEWLKTTVGGLFSQPQLPQWPGTTTTPTGAGTGSDQWPTVPNYNNWPGDNPSSGQTGTASGIADSGQDFVLDFADTDNYLVEYNYSLALPDVSDQLTQQLQAALPGDLDILAQIDGNTIRVWLGKAGGVLSGMARTVMNLWALVLQILMLILAASLYGALLNWRVIKNTPLGKIVSGLGQLIDAAGHAADTISHFGGVSGPLLLVGGAALVAILIIGGSGGRR